MKRGTQLVKLVFVLLASFCASGCFAQAAVDTHKIETVKITPIPDSAKIIYHENNFIYTMDEDGSNVTQITFKKKGRLEHVAVSYDRTKIVANYWHGSFNPPASKILLYDIPNKRLTHLVPDFHMAGNGGVDWDKYGNVYFAGVSKLPFPKPSAVEEHKANAGANDIYRINFNGTGLKNLTNTKDRGEADVSVSPDSKSISYMAANITDPHNGFTEIWNRDADGENAKLIYVGGKDRVSSVHDPEISPDGKYVVFSRVNKDVAPVFPNKPLANTAHDVIRASITDTNDIFVVTRPGPISIVPGWKHGRILYLEITDKTNPPHAGLATIKPDGSGYKLIRNGANIGKWIPK